MTTNKRIGIDLGGTKIAIAVYVKSGDDNTTGDAIFEKRIATPSGNYSAVIQAIKSLIESAERAVGICDSIGIGTPGSRSPITGLMRNCNSTCLNDKPLLEDLQSALGRPVRMANDADCFALSEATDGAARGARTVFGVILGTGTGGAIVVDGRLLDGPNRVSGEWGHNPCFHPLAEAQACYCGRERCNETQLSGPSFERRYLNRVGNKVESALNAKQIIQLRNENADPVAAQVFEEYIELLAWSMAQVVNVLDPDAIVLGGGMSNIAELYPKLSAAMPAYVFGGAFDTPILPPTYGDASGVRGAAWLWS